MRPLRRGSTFRVVASLISGTMADIKIYADIVNFEGLNKELKDKELTCCLTGKKFLRGEILEFRTSEHYESGENFVHPDEAKKEGYILSNEAERELYAIMDRCNYLDDEENLSKILSDRGYQGEIRKIEKVTRRKILRFEELRFQKPWPDPKEIPF